MALVATPMTWLRQHAWQGLLVFIPVAVGLAWLAPERHLAIFLASALAILPLAGYIGRATEQLADQLGSGIGGMLNATFGNAAELIIGALALHEGLIDLVKASITGSIISNLLLVFGAAAFAGGLRHPVQRFNRTAAGVGTTMMLLATIGLMVPAAFHLVAPEGLELRLDTEIAAVLFVTYCASLVFKLRTHRDLYGTGTTKAEPEADAEAGARPASGGGGRRMPPVVQLLIATALVAVVSELLVGSVREAARALGTSELFAGVIVVALAGNAAEHYSAVTLALADRMDASIAIAVGSSAQIAMFVAPVLVFLSYGLAPQPMDLLFTTFELVAIGLAVPAMAFIAQDGETTWMEGLQLMAVYVILALGFFFLPAGS
ncbi:MAG: calcium/proton exchanger [Vicinamibacterales bacterium]